MRITRFLSLLLAIALVAAACGGSDDGDDGDSVGFGQQSNDNDGGSDDGGSDGGGDDGGGSDGGGDDGGDDDDDPVMTGDSGSDWCDAVRDAAENPDDSPLNFDFFNASPSELQEQFENNLQVIQMWADQAPPEIDDDVNVMVDTFRNFIDLAGGYDWDFVAMASDPAFETTFNDDAIETASERIDQYTRDVCGVDLGVSVDSGAPAAPVAPEVNDDDPLIVQIFAALGIPGGFIPDDMASCMNDELLASGAFDDGFDQSSLLNEAVLDAFDTAASACGFDDL